MKFAKQYIIMWNALKKKKKRNVVATAVSRWVMSKYVYTTVYLISEHWNSRSGPSVQLQTRSVFSVHVTSLFLTVRLKWSPPLVKERGISTRSTLLWERERGNMLPLSLSLNRVDLIFVRSTLLWEREREITHTKNMVKFVLNKGRLDRVWDQRWSF